MRARREIPDAVFFLERALLTALSRPVHFLQLSGRRLPGFGRDCSPDSFYQCSYPRFNTDDFDPAALGSDGVF
jgi:hypothetical protein